MRHLLGVPRYLWRQAAADAWSAVRAAFSGNRPARFAAAVRVLWFGGYLRESWFGARHQRPAARTIESEHARAPTA
jgi:hypothetical protein